MYISSENVYLIDIPLSGYLLNEVEISSENVYFIDIPLSGYLLNEVEILGFGAAARSLRDRHRRSRYPFNYRSYTAASRPPVSVTCNEVLTKSKVMAPDSPNLPFNRDGIHSITADVDHSK